MEFNLYAPVDCEVKQITKCSDPTFSDKMLGDGVLIIPKSSQFLCPFDNAKMTLIFDTKHAYGFSLGKIEALMHCGLETVQLAGDPFEVQTKVGDELSKGQKLFTVDLNKLNLKKVSSETPIVFTCEDSKINIHDFIEKEYKAGDFICKISTEGVNSNDDPDLEKIFGREGKNQKLAWNIVQNVGGIKNFDEHYNCFSRLRLKILKKDLVNEVAIKKLKV
ncbi:hypothetical protein CG007_00080 [Mesoplasma entomophilum]|uniref:glucose PTS transporter subunit IIA n=1 Tax=Mesoplasma entomophilum TaxID=2149 RepID=UPI000D03D3E6|nr:glucose PTS transporter subunit IIA [Mesoplasma entomophilum]AVN60031.1 hypothetical protein CG007_00080 [Mesoplasma entomophilum]